MTRAAGEKPGSRGYPRFRPVPFCSLWVLAVATAGLFAHESPERTARQNYGISVDSRNIDIEVTTTFFARREPAGDLPTGQKSDIQFETRVDPELLAQSTGGNLKLQVDGKMVPLYRLHRPELELAGPEESLRPRFLRLTFFARTPDWLKPGSRITLQNYLPGQSSLETFFRIEGLDGYRFSQGDNPLRVAGTPLGLLTFEASVLAEPPAHSQAPALQRAAAATDWSSRLFLAWGLLTLAFVLWVRAFRSSRTRNV